MEPRRRGGLNAPRASVTPVVSRDAMDPSRPMSPVPGRPQTPLGGPPATTRTSCRKVSTRSSTPRIRTWISRIQSPGVVNGKAETANIPWPSGSAVTLSAGPPPGAPVDPASESSGLPSIQTSPSSRGPSMGSVTVTRIRAGPTIGGVGAMETRMVSRPSASPCAPQPVRSTLQRRTAPINGTAHFGRLPHCGRPVRARSNAERRRDEKCESPRDAGWEVWRRGIDEFTAGVHGGEP